MGSKVLMICPSPSRKVTHAKANSLSLVRFDRNDYSVPTAYEHRTLGIASHWPFEEWRRFLPEHNTAVSLLDRLVHHGIVVVTSGESFRMKEARARGGQFSSKKQ